MFSYVFLTSHLEIVEITVCLAGFRGARAAAARMCPACHFLQGMVALAGAQTLLKQFKSCSQKPFSQKCLKSGGFSTNPQERAGGDFDNFLLKNHWVF